MSTIKALYAASTAITITLASLASDTNMLAGRASAVFSNVSNLYTDPYITGKITTGTSPTASTTIEVWAWAIIDDTPTYPDTITGSNANITLTSANVKYSALVLVQVITVDNTSNRTYGITPFSVKAVFGLVDAPPNQFGVFIVHNTGAALHATGSNHEVTIYGVNPQIV